MCRVCEQEPNSSIYKYLCEFEWNTAVGETNQCGGIALVRKNAFKEIDGFDPKFIAGEEGEMCLRMRRKGWKVWKLGQDMTDHDADLRNFRQWWIRMMRGGYSNAMGSSFSRKRSRKILRAISISLTVLGLLTPVFLLLTLFISKKLALIVAMTFQLKLFGVHISQSFHSPNPSQYSHFL